MGEAKRRKSAGPRLRRLVAPLRPSAIAKLVVPAGPGLPPHDTMARAAAIAETIRTRVRAHLVRASESGSLARMLSSIEAIGAECTALFEAELRGEIVANKGHGAEMALVQCRRGCAFCCHVDVDVTALEAIRLAQREIIAGGGAQAAHEQADEAGAGRYRPCPLLADGACRSYESRPFACRSLFSHDAGRCAEGFASATPVVVPSLDWPRFLSCGYITGQIAALDDLRLASHMVELRGSLALLCADETAVPRWLDGEDVFPRKAARSR